MDDTFRALLRRLKAGDTSVRPALAQAHKRLGTRPVIVKIRQDSDVDSPLEYDGWRLYTFMQQGRFGGADTYRDPETLGITREWRPSGESVIKVTNPGLRRRLKVGLAFFVDYSEHGLCQWSVSSAGHYDPFDTSYKAGLLVWEQPPKNLGPKTYEDREKDAEGFLETYTKWCNGDTWWFSIEKEDGEDIESCGGFIGAESLFQEIASIIDYLGYPPVLFDDEAGLSDYHWRGTVWDGDELDEEDEA